MPIVLSPEVSLDGSPLPDAWLHALLEIRIERQFQVPGRCTLRFVDPGYELVGSSKVGLGTEVQIVDAAGEPKLITAEVTAVSVEQPEGDQPELVVVAHDRSHRLGRATKVNSFLSMSYSDVVTKLAGETGLRAVVDPSSAVVDYLLQVDSDLGLITELARRLGYDWWVDDKTLHFQKPAAGTAVALSLGEGLLSFSVRASGHHPDEVVVDGWDRSQQQQVSSSSSTPSQGVAASSGLAGLVTETAKAFGSATLTTAGVAAQSQAEAHVLSQAIYDRGRACAVSARGVTAGNGHITLGGSVQVDNAGPLSGTYPVSSVEHVFRPSRGYVTRFRSGDRYPTSLVDTLSGRPTQGPAHHHQGLTVGVVTNINDPNKSGMVRVRYPGMSSSGETGWARLVAVGGGAGRGAVFVPEVNDEVLVAFEGGDPRQPVVIGGLYSAKSQIPENPVVDGQVNTRTMTSRLGHVVTMLDGSAEAQQAIELQLAGKKHTVHLGKDQLNIVVPDGTPVNVVAGQTSIKFAKDGSMTLSGQKISIQATAEMELKAPTIKVSADAQLALEGQAQAALKGTQVQVQGTAMVTISGTPVAIN